LGEGDVNKNYAKTTAKCVEVSKCFINKSVGLYDYELEDTLTIGNLARLSANIKNTEILSVENLVGIGTAIKQEFRIIRSEYLPILEDLGWIEVQRQNSKINKIYESMPPLQDILGNLGILYEEREPGEVDRATIKSLSSLTKKPIKKDTLISETDVKEENFQTAMDYGLNTNYFGTFRSYETNEEIMFTPYYWNRNKDKTLKFLKRQTYDEFSPIEKLISQVYKVQGQPIERIIENSELLNEGIECGFFPSIGITDPNRNQKYKYVFNATPQFDLEPNKDIFEKARMIVACFRHGQFHASTSRIRNPLAVLSSLRANMMRPHSHALVQYGLLVNERICKAEKVADYGGSYRIRFIKNPENIKAMDLAKSMLEDKEPIMGVVYESSVDKFVKDGVFNYANEQRKLESLEQISAKGEYIRMLEYIQGDSLG